MSATTTVYVDRRRHRRNYALAVALAGTVVGLGSSAWYTQQSKHLRGELETVRQALQVAGRERVTVLARVEEQREAAQSERRELEARIEAVRGREEDLTRRLAAAASTEVDTLRGELQVTHGRLQALESERAAAERIIKQYGNGVCLIQGTYAFYDEQGRPLRRAPPDGDGDLLTVEGEGEVHTVDFYGTGFLVDRAGLVLTNRHLAEPWWNDEEAERLQAAGFEPRFQLFRAFFPREERPFTLAVERSADKVDLALLRMEPRAHHIPVLPLDRTEQGAVAGAPILVVGYPTGLEAIMAKAETGVVRKILTAHGSSSERVTEALSAHGLIRPSTTQGHIGDVTRTDIVFDAPTTQGGSGGPLFNRNGEVVGVEYAVLSKFGGNSFGVPIAYAHELLRPRRSARNE